jgi:hypothetical protein
LDIFKSEHFRKSKIFYKFDIFYFTKTIGKKKNESELMGLPTRGGASGVLPVADVKQEPPTQDLPLEKKRDYPRPYPPPRTAASTQLALVVLASSDAPPPLAVSASKLFS